MAINDRIKELRITSKLTQSQFAARTGISRSGLANIEAGTAAPSEVLVKLIVAEFRVDEVWLRTGAGEMYSTASQEKEDAIARMIADIMTDTSDGFKKKFVASLARLGESEWLMIQRFVDSLANKEE